MFDGLKCARQQARIDFLPFDLYRAPLFPNRAVARRGGWVSLRFHQTSTRSRASALWHWSFCMSVRSFLLLLLVAISSPLSGATATGLFPASAPHGARALIAGTG